MANKNSIKRKSLPFIGRSDETAQLNALLHKKTASLVVVKGRRRVGKSRLLEEFIQGKRAFSFRGLAPTDKTTAQSERDEFARQLSEATQLPQVQFDDWSKAFALLAQEIRTRKIIIIFDEISWMGSKDPLFISKLKDAWEEYFKKNPKLILILCGSISTWIDDNIINNTGFYGRISWTLNVKPLPLSDANALLKIQGFDSSAYEKFKILSVTGGIPWYIEQMQGQFSAEENIKRQCFTEGGTLVDEYDRIFREMFGKKDVLYKKIIKSLSNNALEYDEISEESHYQSSGRLSAYLENLTKAGFISRDCSWNFKTGKPSVVSRFRLSDNYIRFYLKYIDNKRAQIEKGQFKNISLSALPALDTIWGLQFENLIVNNRDLIIKHLNIRQEDIVYDNPFLQRQTASKKGCQVDYLIQTKHKALYLCEIKFSRQSITASAIEQVQEKINRLSVPRNVAVHPVLIHVNGVTPNVVEKDFFYAIIDFGALLAAS